MRVVSSMLLVAGLIVTGALQVRAELANGIKAIVHDSVITYEDVEALTTQTADVLVRQYRNQPETFEKKINDMREENLQKLMDRQLILHEFKAAGYTLPESVIDDVVQERIRSRFGDRVTLTKTLQAQGITYEKFREQVREQFIVEALRAKNVSSEIIISPHKVESYYLAHRENYKVEDQVKLRMILLNKGNETNAPTVCKLAEEISGKLKEGASFAEMATIYSQDSYRNQGGNRGWVETKQLRKELAEAACNLKPGQPSGVIETPDSYYLMLVEETRPTHFKSLGEVRDEIERNLVFDEKNRLEKQWLERLKKKTFVRYF